MDPQGDSSWRGIPGLPSLLRFYFCWGLLGSADLRGVPTWKVLAWAWMPSLSLCSHQNSYRRWGPADRVPEGGADGKEDTVHVSVATAPLWKIELIPFHLQRPGTKPGHSFWVLESQLLVLFQKTYLPIKIVIPKAWVPFSVLSEAFPPNSRLKLEKWAPFPPHQHYSSSSEPSILTSREGPCAAHEPPEHRKPE